MKVGNTGAWNRSIMCSSVRRRQAAPGSARAVITLDGWWRNECHVAMTTLCVCDGWTWRMTEVEHERCDGDEPLSTEQESHAGSRVRRASAADSARSTDDTRRQAWPHRYQHHHHRHHRLLHNDNEQYNTPREWVSEWVSE